MNKESVKAFVLKMNTDEAFFKKAMECKRAEEFEAFVKAEGFDFTYPEFAASQRELADEELEQVAGAYGHKCYTPLFTSTWVQSWMCTVGTQN